MDFKEGIGKLNKRIQSCSLVVMVLAAGIVVPLAVERSNQKKVYRPTVICAYLTFLFGVSLRGLVSEFVDPKPGRRRYIAVKILIHACALLLVVLSFSLSLMMSMNVVVTSFTLTAAALYVAHRLWQCVAAALERDLVAYMGCEEELHQLLEMSTGFTSILFGGWYGMAFFYFQNYPEEARDARFLPSEYLTFFTSVAASLMLVKAVPRRLSMSCRRPVRELMALVCALVCSVVATALVCSVVATALVIAASKVGGYAVLALVPEAIAFAAWCAQRADEKHVLPITWPEWLGYGQRGGDHGEPASHSFINVSLTLLLAVLSYRVKDVRALSTVYDESFVLVTTTAVVAALGWRILTQPPTPIRAAGVQAAAKVLAFSTFWLLLLSVLAFLGVIFGW